MSAANLLPPPDSGVHSWLFGCGCELRRRGHDQHAALSLLAAHVAGSNFRAGRTVPAKEIAEAIEAAYRGAPPRRTSGAPQLADDFDPVSGWPATMTPPRAELDRTRQERVLAKAGKFGLADLWEASPIRPPDKPAPRWALKQLFAKEELLCIGKTSADFTAKPLGQWRDAELLDRQLIVPNPLRKPAGTTKDGKLSAHSRDAVGARRYIVVEFDGGLTSDQQAAILDHLRTDAAGRLAAVVLSGGKSMHGWFRCDGVPAARLYRWFQYAVSLGADPRLWLPEQFCRLPDGKRDNGTRQSVIFFNDAP